MPRVGTTIHNEGGIRVSSSVFEGYSDAAILDVSPDPIRPGLTVTVTTIDSTGVDGVFFGGVPQAFSVASGTTVTFTAPDEFLYGMQPVRIEDDQGFDSTVLRMYQPVEGNMYVSLNNYPPGLNQYGDQILHLGEELDPQPVNGMQIEIKDVAEAWDFELYEDASYSLLDEGQIQRRAIYANQDASTWDDVYINVLPEEGDAIASGFIRPYEMIAPSGNAVGQTLGTPTNLFTSNITRTSARANWTSAG